MESNKQVLQDDLKDSCAYLILYKRGNGQIWLLVSDLEIVHNISVIEMPKAFCLFKGLNQITYLRSSVCS